MAVPRRLSPSRAAVLLAATSLWTAALALEADASGAFAAGGEVCATRRDHALLQRQAKHDKALALDGDGPVIGSGDQVFLTAFTGNPLTVQDGHVHAKLNAHGAWQTFTIEKDGGGSIEEGDHVYLRTHGGNYLTVEAERVHASWGGQRGAWQQFVVEKKRGHGKVRHADAIFLRAHTGKRITVMPEGDVDAVHARWDHQGEWQELTVERREAEAEATTTGAPAVECAAAWGQCGGANHRGPTCCVAGYACHDKNDYHSICRPISSSAPATTTPSPSATTTPAATTTSPAPTTTAPARSTPVPSTTTQASEPSPSPTTSARPTDDSWIKGTWTTGYWDCCKPSCSWPGKGNVDSPVRACQAGTSFPLEDVNVPSVCGGAGAAASCPNNAPWAYSSNLSFGFAAAAVSGSHGLMGDDNCGQCFELRFVGGVHENGGWGGSHPRLEGKTMVVQVTNIGYDVAGEHSFDLQIPGAGQGAFSDGCEAQFSGFSVGDFDCGNLYGGCREKSGCERLPLELQAGCQWRYDWYYWLREGGKSNNPFVDFRRVKCPEQIIAVTGSTPLDDDDFPAVNLADFD